jgi:hypothetical protein
MIIIEIPFMKDFYNKLRYENKTATTRNKAYGEVGSIFKVNELWFEITHIIHLPLSVVKKHFFLEEGFESPDEFEKCWKKLHPMKGYDPSQNVYLHLFRRITSRRVFEYE